MKAELYLDRNLRFIGKNVDGLETVFDTHPEVGGEDTAATPMEVMLQALAACASMDIVSILRKKKKSVDAFKVLLDGERKDTHPKVFTRVIVKFVLTSDDAEMSDLERAVSLSTSTYCSINAMFKASGCEMIHELEIIRP